MATLDKSKPFGISVGNPTHAYVQDDKHFNHKGDEVDASGSPVESEPAPKVQSKTKITPPTGKAALLAIE